MSLQQKSNYSWQELQERFSVDAKNSWQSKGGDIYELTRSPLPRQNLLLGLMPCRPWRLQQSGLCVVLQNSRQPALPHVKQSAWVPHRNNHAVDRHHWRAPQPRGLHTVDDRQHNGQRLDENQTSARPAMTPSKQWLALTQRENTRKYFWTQTWRDLASGSWVREICRRCSLLRVAKD